MITSVCDTALGAKSPGLSPHQNLAQSIGADNKVVGGMFRRGTNGEILLNEHSGHYHQNWNDEIRKQLGEFLHEMTGQKLFTLPDFRK